MKLLEPATLTRLTTKRLLAYRNSLYRVPEGPSRDNVEVPYRNAAGDWHHLHKGHPVWKQALATVKTELARRAHVDR